MGRCHWMVGAAVIIGTVATLRAEPQPVFVRFRDGSLIRRAHIEGPILLETPFGKLTIPIDKISRIDFGFRVPEDIARQIGTAIQELSGPDYRKRDLASRRLVAFGVLAYPALLQAQKNADKETARRAAAALEQIREHTPPEHLKFRKQDVVYTFDSLITGRIINSDFRTTTRYFGTVKLQLHDLATIYSIAGAGEKVFKLRAADFAKNPECWFATGLSLHRSLGLQVEANGQIQFTVPDESPSPQGALDHVAVLSGPDGSKVSEKDSPIPFGTLLGRIGDDGPVFRIGKKLVATTDSTGPLFLRIFCPPGKASGAYRVFVRVDPEITGGKIRAVSDFKQVSESLPRVSPRTPKLAPEP
ncbi:MAG: hypothetical protein KatS3mg105_1378 [Gemmatales bacterium]|nr:MAG: hypothetical protein KatS3mg105_1378 [Gemmatales bacterium]